MLEIVGGMVRYCDLVAKIKIAKFFPDMLVIFENLSSQKFPAVRFIVSILDVTHVIKCIRFSSSLAQIVQVRGYMHPPATKSDKVDLW